MRVRAQCRSAFLVEHRGRGCIVELGGRRDEPRVFGFGLRFGSHARNGYWEPVTDRRGARRALRAARAAQ